MSKESMLKLKQTIVEKYGFQVDGKSEAELNAIISDKLTRVMKLKEENGVPVYSMMRNNNEFFNRISALPDEQLEAELSKYRILNLKDNKGIDFEKGKAVLIDNAIQLTDDFNAKQKEKASNAPATQKNTQIDYSSFALTKEIAQKLGFSVEGKTESELDATLIGSGVWFYALKEKDGLFGYHGIHYEEFFNNLSSLPEDPEKRNEELSKYRILDLTKDKAVDFENGNAVLKENAIQLIEDFNNQQKQKLLAEHIRQYAEKESQANKAKVLLAHYKDERKEVKAPRFSFIHRLFGTKTYKKYQVERGKWTAKIRNQENILNRLKEEKEPLKNKYNEIAKELTDIPSFDTALETHKKEHPPKSAAVDVTKTYTEENASLVETMPKHISSQKLPANLAAKIKDGLTFLENITFSETPVSPDKKHATIETIAKTLAAIGISQKFYLNATESEQGVRIPSENEFKFQNSPKWANSYIDDIAFKPGIYKLAEDLFNDPSKAFDFLYGKKNVKNAINTIDTLMPEIKPDPLAVAFSSTLQKNVVDMCKKRDFDTIVEGVVVQNLDFLEYASKVPVPNNEETVSRFEKALGGLALLKWVELERRAEKIGNNDGDQHSNWEKHKVVKSDDVREKIEELIQQNPAIKEQAKALAADPKKAAALLSAGRSQIEDRLKEIMKAQKSIEVKKEPAPQKTAPTAVKKDPSKGGPSK